MFDNLKCDIKTNVNDQNNFNSHIYDLTAVKTFQESHFFNNHQLVLDYAREKLFNLKLNKINIQKLCRNYLQEESVFSMDIFFLHEFY